MCWINRWRGLYHGNFSKTFSVCRVFGPLLTTKIIIITMVMIQIIIWHNCADQQKEGYWKLYNHKNNTGYKSRVLQGYGLRVRCRWSWPTVTSDYNWWVTTKDYGRRNCDRTVRIQRRKPHVTMTAKVFVKKDKNRTTNTAMCVYASPVSERKQPPKMSHNLA